jgi:hypothetical protein
MEKKARVFCQIDVQEFHLWAHRGNMERESPPEGPVHYSPYSKHLSPRLSPPEEGGEGVLKKGKSEEKRYQIFTFIYSTHICTFFPYKE